MNRPRINSNRDGGLYFGAPRSDIKFIPTGSKLLDLAIGGGWAQGRVVNIVGDKSTGKSLLAIEAAANFSRLYPHGKEDIGYRETEHAFLPRYAQTLGMPLDRLDNWNSRDGKLTRQLRTVEDWFDDLSDVIKESKAHDRRQPPPYLYIVDSLDAMSDADEQDRDIRKGTYGGKKPKVISELFRRLAADMERHDITLLIINQVRSKIGIHFGRDVERTGGRALDFYSSQAVFLADIGKTKRTIRGQDRVTGVNIVAKVDKNKISQSYRAVEFPILFGYGIDDLRSCLNWLKELKALNEFGIRLKKEESRAGKDPAKAAIDLYITKFEDYSAAQRKEEINELHEVVNRLWWDIEKQLLPRRKKYED